jgi:hypothetical protein
MALVKQKSMAPSVFLIRTAENVTNVVMTFMELPRRQ